jgi:AcrR family transcriptional regulator
LKVAAEVKVSRRKYHSPLRADQARETRRRVLEAAFRLFVERGYAGTTIVAVAEEAGVSPETVYLSLGGKRGLLEAVIETAITGEEDRATGESALSAEIARLPTARERLDRMVEFTCGILARTRPVHSVIRGAADKEPFANDLGRRLLQERLRAQTERIRRFISEDLKEELAVSEAGERYCALASPELYHLLTAELGWSADRHRAWLTDLMTTELLGPDAAR